MLMQWQMADFRSDRRLMTVVPSEPGCGAWSQTLPQFLQHFSRRLG
jgi:hypothetical protein